MDGSYRKHTFGGMFNETKHDSNGFVIQFMVVNHTMLLCSGGAGWQPAKHECAGLAKI